MENPDFLCDLRWVSRKTKHRCDASVKEKRDQNRAARPINTSNAGYEPWFSLKSQKPSAGQSENPVPGNARHAAQSISYIRKTKNAVSTDGVSVFIGGDKRDRTADLLNAIQALSQLSYTPGTDIIISYIFRQCNSFSKKFQKKFGRRILRRPIGF